MVYTNLLRRTSSRLLLSAQQQKQQQQQALFFSTQQAIATTATTTSSSVSQSAPIHRPGVRTIASSAIHTRSETIRVSNNICFEELPSMDLSHGTMAMATRSKHSSTQIKRLFKQNPAKRRIALKQNTVKDEGVIPESTLQAQIADPKFLSNGWNPPAETDEKEDYPFQVARTKNKPNDAVGFLPVYSEYRKDGARVTTRIKKVSGDRSLFLNELRAALQIPIPKNPREDTIRIRTGGTIEIKGNRVAEVKTWLAGLGF